MENKDYIQKELQEIAPAIVQIDTKNLYSVPPTYFNDLSDKILNKLNQEKEAAYNFPRLMPYQVPVDYFDNLAKSILQKLEQHTESSEVYTELESISPILNTISKKPLYSVPEGYFDKNIDPAVTQTVSRSAKVVSLPLHTKFIRYALAAVITAIMAVGMYLLVNDKSSEASRQNSNPTVAVKKLSEAEIADFLKTNFAAEEVTTAPYDATVKENDIKKSVKEVSDKEIQQFLQEEGETDEI